MRLLKSKLRSRCRALFLSDFLSFSEATSDVCRLPRRFLRLQYLLHPLNVFSLGERWHLVLEVCKIAMTKFSFQPCPIFFDRIEVGAVRWDLPQRNGMKAVCFLRLGRMQEAFAIAEDTPRALFGRRVQLSLLFAFPSPATIKHGSNMLNSNISTSRHCCVVCQALRPSNTEATC